MCHSKNTAITAFHILLTAHVLLVVVCLQFKHTVHCIYELIFLDLFPRNPAVTPGSVLHMECSIKSNNSNRTSADLQFVLELSNHTKIPIYESHFKVINTTTVVLNYPDIPLHFNYADISCRDLRNNQTVTDWLRVGCKCRSAFVFCLLICCT